MPKPKTRKGHKRIGGGVMHDGSGQQNHMAEMIRTKQILGDVLDLVMKAKSASQLRKVLNSASWKIKKAVLVEALELNNLDKANKLATEILNLTEVKKAKVQSNININENVQILMAEIQGVPFEVLEHRAGQISRKIEQTRRLGTGSDRRGDEGARSREVLLVEN